MAFVCGIYGYEFTREFCVAGWRFMPRSPVAAEAHAWARDPERYQLTGVLVGAHADSEQLARLEAILSFIEHMDVILSRPQPPGAQGPFHSLPATILVSRRYSGGGAILAPDSWLPRSRPVFIEAALERLADEAFCEESGYRPLFFKVAEAYRQRRPYLEVSFFLLFSGLETYVRRTLRDDETRKVAVPMAHLLQRMGFQVYEDNPEAPARSLQTYANFRNTLFHSGKLEFVKKDPGGTPCLYRLQDYFVHFRILVSLALLRATGFDDGHTNWDAWIDRTLLR